MERQFDGGKVQLIQTVARDKPSLPLPYDAEANARDPHNIPTIRSKPFSTGNTTVVGETRLSQTK